MSYGYAPRYLQEEQEYSESDCPSEGQVMHQNISDVTELYRRKQAANQARNQVGTYYHHTHMQQGYYEPQSRLPTTCTCNLPPDPRYYYYKTPSQNQDGAYRSSPQIGPNLRTCHDAPPLTKTPSAAIKKYPVTARTPRYYKCPAAPLCKRPSTLCLPVTCQPDPAASHRPRKGAPELYNYRVGHEGSYVINDDASRTVSKRTEVRQVDSEGDVNSRLNDLENLLTKFDVDEDEGENDPVEISGVGDLSKILKPKVPASVKAKQDKICKLKVVKPSSNEPITTSLNVGKLEVKEASPEESLDILLNQHSKENLKEGDNRFKESPRGSKTSKESPRLRTANLANKQRLSFIGEQQKPPLDDNSALELHRSKSYIVSLIDKALSKELGTIPGDKCTRKEFLSMNPKRAIDLVNRHATPRLFNTENRVTVQPSQSCSPKKGESCDCTRVEEPLYLRQLKQLRWSHLRHIQREAKRLADLERFLDSFGEMDNSL